MEPQHKQIDDAIFTINAHGVIIEITSWQISYTVDGRCCGRKTHGYKKALASGPGSCCFKCSREYDTDGRQIPNWAYELNDDKTIFRRNKPTGKV